MTPDQPTILLIEDNDIDVMALQRTMRRHSIDLPIVRANDGEEALEMLLASSEPPRVKSPYVIILDLNMPRMTGFEFLNRVAAEQQLADVPIFILSTSNNPADKGTARQYNVCGYFVKPIEVSGLKQIIAAAA